MDTGIQELIVDLKVISLIEPNGKLYLNHGSFALETNSFLLPIKRYLYTSFGGARPLGAYDINRYTICQKIHSRVNELESLLKTKEISQDWIKHEIAKMITPLRKGLYNLQQTYITDSQIRASLDLIISLVEHIGNAYFKDYNTSEE